MIWPLLLLFLPALSTSSQASLYDPAAFAELTRYRHCVKILHELLLVENCSDLATREKIFIKKREVISEKNQYLLAVEKLFLEQLNDMLISCRKRKLEPKTTIKPTTLLLTTETQPDNSALTTDPTTTKPTATNIKISGSIPLIARLQ